MKSVFHNDPCFCNYTALPFVMSKRHPKIEFDGVKKKKMKVKVEVLTSAEKQAGSFIKGTARSHRGEKKKTVKAVISGDLGFLLRYGCVQERW